MFECGSNVEPAAAAKVPCFADAWFVVDDDGASNRSQRGGIKVEGAVEVLPCRYFWGESGLLEEVESELGLGEEMIPEKVGERVGNAGEDRQKVSFEILDGSLGDVASMDV